MAAGPFATGPLRVLLADLPLTQTPERGRILWIDLEMTGLDPQRDRILEIATLVTDMDLQVLAEGPELVIHQPGDVLQTMSAWCREHHAASGLSDRVRRSAIRLEEAESRTLEFVESWFPGFPAHLAGNSVHQDRAFLMHHMPRLAARIHYRIIDVSGIKELVRRWYPALFESKPNKADAHRAMEDVRQSLAELRWYREKVFRPPEKP